jgi:hypothetical protein
MTNPKVLIHVIGGVAYWATEGDVDVELVDEDNIKMGDNPVQLGRDWKDLARAHFGLVNDGLIKIRDI